MMNLTSYLQLNTIKPDICPKCGREIEAGGPGSGCDPAVAEANGTKCGRPPGSGNKKPDKPVWAKPVRGLDGKPALIRGKINGKDAVLVKKPDRNNPDKMRWYLEVEGQEVHDFFSLNHAKWNIGKNPDKFAKPSQTELDRRQVGKDLQDLLKKEPVPKAAPAGQADPRGSVGPFTEMMRSTLSTTAITEKRVMGGGVNASYKLKFADGSRGTFKPAAGEAGWLVNAVGGPLYQREAIASEWGKIVGMKYMPEVVVREVDGQIGSVHRWAEGHDADSDNDWSYKSNSGSADKRKAYWNTFEQDSARDIAAFDWIASNSDRHPRNFLVDTREGKQVLIPIDHGAGFHGKRTSSEVLRFVQGVEDAIPQHTKDKWAGKWPMLQRSMNNHELPGKQQDALKKRYDAFMSAKNWRDLTEAMMGDPKENDFRRRLNEILRMR